MTESCPLCGGHIQTAHQVNVCASCHHDMLAVGDLSVRSTGEFRAPSALFKRKRREPRQTDPPPGAIACTWCSRGAGEVKKLLSRGSAHICNQCVGLCADILTAELGDDWRN